MGSRSSRRSRGTKRGLASFVSFVVLFALALGQGSSLIALADDPGTVDPVATGEVAEDGASGDAILPTEEGPAEEGPAEEGPAEEGLAEEGPAEEGPAEEGLAEDESATSGGGAGGTRTLKSARSPNGDAVIQSHGGLHGGDVSLDFVAAGPGTYDHSTGLGTHPQFGYDNRTISKTNGVVESLEGGDFECGDLVTFFVQIVIAEDAEGSGTVELDMSFGAETTGQPGLGFDSIVSYGINTPDDGNVGNVNDNVVTAVPVNGAIETAGYDELKATLTVTNLAPGETAIVRVTVHLDCEPGETPTGNILNAIEGARADGERISVGQQTVPMKQIGELAEPGIEVFKDCPTDALAGEEITYEITVTNTGNVNLSNITVIDDIIGDLSAEFPDTLDAGSDPVTVEVQYTPVPADGDPVVNTVTATGDWEAGGESDTVTATSECTTNILNPAISITKTCPATALDGDDVTYTITIQNTGDEALENVEVWDTVNGDDPVDLSGLFPDTLAVGSAAVSVDWTYTADGTEPDPLPNSATVTADGVTSGAAVEDTDGCQTDILNPDIDVTKSCTEFAQVGDTITYTITVTNTGDEDLEGITVDDTLLGDLSDDFADTLAAGDSESHDFDYLVTDQSPDPVPNSVTATGTGVSSEEVVDDTAGCSTDLLFPAINIVKDGPELVHRGDTITYTFEVTNPGEVELFDVELTDPICDAGTIFPGADVDSSLAVGEVWHFTCLHLVTTEDPDPIPNTATVRGDTEEGEGGNEVTDTDDHVVDIISPAIDIVKTVDEEVVPVGTTVTYTYVITNTGDTTLYEISVDDDILGHIGDIAVLEPGQSVTLTRDFVVGDEPVINVGTAEGEDVLGRSVSADDDATVTPIAGENPPNPPNNPPTPFTGSDAGRLGLITIVLFGIGVTVVASTRRRRPERDAA